MRFLGNRSVAVAAFVALAIGLTLPSVALAQRDAGSKIRGDYNFYSGQSGRNYQRHAADHARVLNDYSSAGQPVPKAIIQEHATAVRSNVVSAQKAYSHLAEVAKKDPAAEKQLKVIETAHDKVLAMCDMLDGECAKAEGDSAMICKCCADIEKHLKEADEAHEKLMKQLKLEAPKDVSKK